MSKVHMNKEVSLEQTFDVALRFIYGREASNAIDLHGVVFDSVPLMDHLGESSTSTSTLLHSGSAIGPSPDSTQQR